MSTITDIRTIGITTSDQDKAITFYRDTLDFVVRLDVDGPTRWIEVAPAGADVSLALVAGDREAGEVTETGIRFNVPDAAAARETLSARGVSVGELLLWPGVPPMFTFDDPDGNRFVILEQTAAEAS
ncbi:VOC family protein [Nocardioides sp. NPDC023903]|uniref:VOC family protein n=1 Tax=Nocardioides sp. NPDC023903 TaxID=3157195 RepID=UPI0034111513